MAHVDHHRLFQGLVLLLGLLILGIMLAAAPTIAQTPLTLDLTITDTTVDPQTGRVTIYGTVTCSEPASYSVSVSATQYVGRTTAIRGSGYTSGTCAGPQGSPFTITLFGTNGRFGPGQVLIDAYAFGCVGTPYPASYPTPSCDSDQETLTTRLRPARP